MKYSITVNLDKALKEAGVIAKRYSNPSVGTEHVLYGLIKIENSAAGKLLRRYGVDDSFAERVLGGGTHVAMRGEPAFTARVSSMFSTAWGIAQDVGKEDIGTEHYLYCMLLDQTSIASHILREIFGVPVSDMMRDLKSIIDSGKSGDEPIADKNAAVLPAALEGLGVDITKKARENKIDPIIGRTGEIERIIQILCRKTKNNPVLIGEPGVGKSAVVEGLAVAIVEGRVPELLKNKIIFSLDMASLVAGTMYRGAMEEKLKRAIDEVRASGNIILFIDELHTLAQAGGKEGEVSPSDILKPYLARGELQTVGATTTEEYAKYIEKDKALERRFQPVTVEPPSVEETIRILKGLKENYESFHKVSLSDEAIEAAAKLSDRYITDRFLPDKAIDLIDEAMSKAKVSGNTAPASQRELEQKLAEVQKRRRDALSCGQTDAADRYDRECDDIRSRIDETRMNWYRTGEHTPRVITAEDVAEVVSKWTNIPVTRLSADEKERLIGLEEELSKRVIGQDDAVRVVAKAIRRARAGLKDPSRPIGSFLFLGPTGVGKTELTKALSAVLFDDENAVIRIDMSEYMEAHSVSKLIGAPPGYSGFEDGGQLTDAVRRRPYSVVLFDELEKAHSDVYNLLLQLLEDGRLTDSQGRVVSFKNTVIIMTSNVGASEIARSSEPMGFYGSEDDEARRAEKTMQAALRRHFKPEFINRIDSVCYFKSLSRRSIGRIAGIMLDKFEKNLREKGMKLDITPDALDLIVEKGYDSEYGARPLRRVIEREIEDEIAEGLISGRLKENSTITVTVCGGEISVR